MKKIIAIAASCLCVIGARAMVDSDGTGLSDVYEFIYFNGPADAFGDPDGDTVNTYEEMVWGTNPTNAASKVTGPTMSRVGNTLQFTWPAAAYRYYELRASEDFATWQTVGSGAVSSYEEDLGPVNAPGRRFYHLSVALESGAVQATRIIASRSGQDLVLSWAMAGSQVYELQSSSAFSSWDIVNTNATSPYAVNLAAPGAPDFKYYRLRISGEPRPVTGLDAWEEDLYQQTFGVAPSERDSDGDGLYDQDEFLGGHTPGKKDHPAVGLVVFTPLEK